MSLASQEAQLLV